MYGNPITRRQSTLSSGTLFANEKKNAKHKFAESLVFKQVSGVPHRDA